jgi:AraC-like DNA-binding protein
VILRARPPSKPLSKHVQYLWYHEGLDWSLERLLPNGAIELIVDLSEGPRQWGDGEFENKRSVSRSWLSGQHSRPITVEGATNSCMIGVQFKPGGASPFVPGPVAELNDNVTELDALWRSLANELRERLLETQDIETRFTILETVLMQRAAGRLTVDQSMAYVLHRLQASPESITIRQLASDVGLSQKRLMSMFERHVGLKPKMLSRVLRLQRVLQHVELEPATPWSILATQYGYSDQSHLVKDFGAITSLRPTQYLKAKGESLNWVPFA